MLRVQRRRLEADLLDVDPGGLLHALQQLQCLVLVGQRLLGTVRAQQSLGAPHPHEHGAEGSPHRVREEGGALLRVMHVRQLCSTGNTPG